MPRRQTARVIELRHTVLRNLARYEARFRAPADARFVDHGSANYSWASSTLRPRTDSLLLSTFALLRTFKECSAGPWSARRPFELDAAWAQLRAAIESHAFVFRPIQRARFDAQVRTYRRNQFAAPETSAMWTGPDPIEEALEVNSAWNFALLVGRSVSTDVLVHWGTNE